jgi:hypothetical protein
MATKAQSLGTQSNSIDSKDPPPPSEAIRKITDHFISFIQKIDTFFEEEM